MNITDEACSPFSPQIINIVKGVKSAYDLTDFILRIQLFTRSAIGRLDPLIPFRGQAILNLVEFIEKTLPDFTNSQEFVDILEKKKNENQYSKAFCLYMIYKSKSESKEYGFISETIQKGSHTIDIGIYEGTNLIFTIEAKVLPTPKGTKKKPRAEYGINRDSDYLKLTIPAQ